jgi:hypothetical protein
MTTRDVSAFEPHARERREPSGSCGGPRVLFQLEDLRRREGRTPELRAKERTLEQLRWRLTAVARRSVSHDGDAAA